MRYDGISREFKLRHYFGKDGYFLFEGIYGMIVFKLKVK
jgi:hypothetical protein